MIHEIYGINRHIKYVCQQLTGYGFDVMCPNLYGWDKVFDYSQEEEAYRSFMEEIGFSNALHTVKGLLGRIRNEYKKVILVGFSTESSCSMALWRRTTD